MGLFGKSATESTLLPFYQNSSKSSTRGLLLTGNAPFLLTSRRGSRCCQRCLILSFFIFFIAIFISTISYLPDISSRVHSVGRDFLIPDRSDGSYHWQPKKERKPIPVPFLSTSTVDLKKIKSDLDGKLHGGGNANVEGVDQAENEIQVRQGSSKELENRRQLIIKVIILICLFECEQ